MSVDLWVAAREACQVAGELCPPTCPARALAFMGLGAVLAHNVAAAETHLLAAQQAARGAGLYVVSKPAGTDRAGADLSSVTYTPLADAILAALAAVRALTATETACRTEVIDTQSQEGDRHE